MDNGLLGVAIGGFIAIVGSAIGPTLQHFLTDRSRREAARLANVQAIIVAVHELEDWLEKKRANIAFGKEHEVGLSPLATVEALTRVHFPEAKIDLLQLSLSVAQCNGWAIDRMVERVNGRTQEMGNWTEVIRGFGEAKSNLIQAVCGDVRLDYEKAYAAQAASAAAA